MGHYVHLHVVFNCAGADKALAKAAAKHRALLPLDESGHPKNLEAGWYLDHLASGGGIYDGPKGVLVMWGTVGNYTLGDEFVETLTPFFGEVLREIIAGHRHICVFCEPEQSERCTVFEIFLEDYHYTDDPERVAVKRHDGLPFAFMQM